MIFWWDAPVKAQLRQQMELNLILKWRSPFSKKNWTMWGRPLREGDETDH